MVLKGEGKEKGAERTQTNTTRDWDGKSAAEGDSCGEELRVDDW